MTIFLHGPETFLVVQRAGKLKQSFKEKNPNASLEEFDVGETIDKKVISQSLASGGGFFSQKKMIVLVDLFVLSASEQEEFLKIFKNSQEALKKENQDTVVLIVERSGKKVLKSSKLLKFIQKFALVEEFKKMAPAQMNKWIADQVSVKSGGKVAIETGAASELVRINNNDLWKIDRELEKLVALVSEGQIGLQAVNEVCSGQAQVKIFDLVDAVGAGNVKRALELKQQVLAQGESEFYVFTMIVSQLRNLVKVRECMNQGISNPAQIAQKTKMHPFVAQKTLAQVSRFSQNKLKKTYQQACRLDLAAKKGEVDMKEGIDEFLVRI